MPTTLSGLLLFVVLLLPGFAYLVGKERSGTERQASPFRETVAIVAASITSELVVLGLFAIVRWQWPTSTPDVGALLNHSGAYWRGHYHQVAAWSIGMLAVAVALAYTATVPAVRRRTKWLPFTEPYPHDSTVSAWWILFERWAGNRQIDVGCILDDGSYIRGNLHTFNNSADDSPDRELILRHPISYRPPGDDKDHEYPASAACVNARRIVTMFVTYTDTPQLISSSEEEEEPAAEATTVAVQDS